MACTWRGGMYSWLIDLDNSQMSVVGFRLYSEQEVGCALGVRDVDKIPCSIENRTRVIQALATHFAE
jgi:hypothetical protein